MEGERENTRDQTEGSGQQRPISQDTERKESGEFESSAQSGSGSEPPRSMGTKGSEFGQFGDSSGSGQQGQSGTGQSDLGTQADTTLAGRTDQQDLNQDQPGSVGGATGQTDSPGEGFIGQQGSESDEYLQETGSTERATEGQDFAAQGRGALEGEEEDIEGGQSRSPQTDIERE